MNVEGREGKKAWGLGGVGAWRRGGMGAWGDGGVGGWGRSFRSGREWACGVRLARGAPAPAEKQRSYSCSYSYSEFVLGVRTRQLVIGDRATGESPNLVGGEKKNSKRFSPVLPGLKSGARQALLGLRRAPCGLRRTRCFRTDGRRTNAKTLRLASRRASVRPNRLARQTGTRGWLCVCG